MWPPGLAPPGSARPPFSGRPASRKARTWPGNARVSMGLEMKRTAGIDGVGPFLVHGVGQEGDEGDAGQPGLSKESLKYHLEHIYGREPTDSVDPL